MAHVFGERTLATLERLLSLLSAFEVVVWMTDGWPLYESRLKAKATKGQLSESAQTYYKLLILVHPGDARPQPGVNVLQSEDVKLQ
ncbi:IS1 OrfB [Shigella flexneri 2a]|nr:IS1 OrfB [Shigella flexneri 2a]